MKKFVAGMLALSVFSGCQSTSSTSPAALKQINGYNKKVTDLFVGIKTDGLPPEFGQSFVSNLTTQLSQRQIKSTVLGFTDNAPLAKGAAQQFNYSMLCAHAGISSYGKSIVYVKMRCALSEVKTNLVVMTVNFQTDRGWGVGFGDSEAHAATEELVKQMGIAGLI